MIRTGQQALALARRHKILPMSTLIAEVAGGTVRGSWWGHPKGALIYDLANVLHDSPEFVAAKFVEGKVTFIHKSLWPALYRIVSDPSRRRRRWEPLERKILAEVERAGEVESERLEIRWGADHPRFKKAVDRLAQGMAILSFNVHTDKGSHATILRSWDQWATSPLRKASGRIPLEEAVETMRAACGGTLFGLAGVTSTSTAAPRAGETA